MKYQNPILRGCYPDPSICRAGDDFYIVNSTFEFFPAVAVSHSKDLVNWEHIGYCIDRNSQLSIKPFGRQSASGIYAPTIRYKDGTFYMVVTNVTGEQCSQGNFYMWTKDPAGDWSDPVFLGTPGIDPSFFFDDDGKDYYVGTADNKIYVWQIDLSTGKLIGERHVLWGGTGGAYPEGPHIFKKDGWYYLMISEGGTERSHMITMARSRSLFEGYTPCPNNPVLTNRSLLRPIEAVGHADLVEDQNGNWWAVCLGTRTFSYPPKHNLGRETMLLPVDFSGDWPVFGGDSTLKIEYDVDNLPVSTHWENKLTHYSYSFTDEKPDNNWNYFYNPEEENYKYGDGFATLMGNAHSLYDYAQYTWVGVRQCAHNATASVKLSFSPAKEGEEAGLTIFMNCKHFYAASVIFENGRKKLIFYRRIGSLMNREAEILIDTDEVTLEIQSDKDFYSFYYTINGKKEFLGKGETVYITTEVGGSFTGNYYALFAMGNGEPSKTPARFSSFTYDEFEE